MPGILPPVEIGGEHFIDGGIVNSIPVDRAVAPRRDARSTSSMPGASSSRWTPPRSMRDVGFVAFEIARRHRFVRDLAAVPEGIAVHVLPTGDPTPPRFNDLSQLRFRDFSRVDRRIAFAYAATSEYLDSRREPASRRCSSGGSSSRPSSLLLCIVLTLLSPLLLAVTLVADVVWRGGLGLTRLAAFAVVFLASEAAMIVALFMLWIASGFGVAIGAAIRSAHYALLRGWLRCSRPRRPRCSA